jgi:hypothetical protein
MSGNYDLFTRLTSKEMISHKTDRTNSDYKQDMISLQDVLIPSI